MPSPLSPFVPTKKDFTLKKNGLRYGFSSGIPPPKYKTLSMKLCSFTDSAVLGDTDKIEFNALVRVVSGPMYTARRTNTCVDHASMTLACGVRSIENSV